MTLTEFLRARLAEVEELACRRRYRDTKMGSRMLLDVQAKRRIIDLHQPELMRSRSIENPQAQDGRIVDAGSAYEYVWSHCLTCGDTDDVPCQTLRLLALPYQNHPEYRDEWRADA